MRDLLFICALAILAACGSSDELEVNRKNCERYRDHLGPWRYRLLLLVQAVLAPHFVRSLLGLESAEWLRPALRVYPLLVRVGLRSAVQRLLMPPRYLHAARKLDYLAPQVAQ